jgi:hypothetical protein
MVASNTEHRKSNFIRTHIITKIFEKSYKAREITQVPHTSFIYFDEMIRIKNGRINQNINRFGKGGLHGKNEITPLAWSTFSGKQLYTALNLIKERKFYINKEIDGRFFKTRIKR